MLPAFTSFIQLPLMIKFMTEYEFGLFQSAQVIVTLTAIMSCLAVDRAIYRLYYDYSDKGAFLWTLTFSMVLSTALFLLVGFLLVRYELFNFDSLDFSNHILPSVMLGVSLAFLNVPYSITQVEGKPVRYIMISGLVVFSNFGVIIFGLYSDVTSAAGLLKMLSFSTLFLVLYLLFKRLIRFRFVFNIEIFTAIFRFSLPIFFGLLATWSINMIGRIVLLELNGPNDGPLLVGEYAIAQKIAGLVAVVSGALLTAFNPLFYSAMSEETKENHCLINDLSKRLFKIILSSGLMLVVASRYLLSIIFGLEGRIVVVTDITVVSVIILQLVGLFNVHLYQIKRPLISTIILVLSSVVGIAVSIIAGLKYGIIGVSLGSLLAAIINLALVKIYVRKFTGFYLNSFVHIYLYLCLIAVILCLDIIELYDMIQAVVRIGLIAWATQYIVRSFKYLLKLKLS